MAAAPPGRPRLIAGVGEFFDTVVRLRVDCDQDLMDACLARCAYYQMTLSRFDPASDVGKINAARGGKVRVHRTTADVIRASLSYARDSGGLFDITVGAELALWGSSGDARPSDADIAQAASHVGWEGVHVEGSGPDHHVWLDDPAAAIDLGGIAKGFAADDIAAGLEASGVSSGLLDLGGTVRAIGGRPDGGPWSVGVSDPWAPFAEPIATCELCDESLVTSGVTLRTLGAGAAWHILDPRSGLPVATDIASVTLLTRDATDGEGLGKEPFFREVGDALDRLEALPGVEALVVLLDGSIRQTGAGRFSLRVPRVEPGPRR